MKTTFRIFAGISALLLAFSCQQFEVDTQMTDEEYAKHIQLTCDAAQEYNLEAANPQTITFNVSSNAAWKVSGAPEWLRVTPSSSSASGLISDVSLIAQPNATASDRSATLTIASEKYDTNTYTVVVNQSRKGELFVQPCADNFSGDGNTQVFTIESNYSWKARSSETWLTLSKAEGEATKGAKVSIQATASLNEGLERRAIVTVAAGPEETTFEVVQNGVAFNIVVPEDPSVSSVGGDITVEMNTSLSWTVKGDNDAFTVEKTDAKHFKVSAPYNNKFTERSVKVTVESKVGKEELVIKQDCNFRLENCEVLPDGSVRLTDAQKSRIYLKGEHRFIEATFTFGDKDFKKNGECWFTGTVGDNWSCNIYNQITVGGNTRFRTDGNRADGVSVYANSSFSLSQDDLNAMTSYYVKIAPASDENVMNLVFKYNGSSLVDDTNHKSPFAGFSGSVDDYYFGFYHSASDGTTYVVTSGEYKDIAE